MDTLNHLNNHHGDVVEKLASHFGKIKETKGAKAVNIDESGIDIKTTSETIRVPFLRKVDKDNEGYRLAIQELLASLNFDDDFSRLNTEINNFINSFKSVFISSLNKDACCVASYAPFVRIKDEIFIMVSEMAEHFISIKTNPTQVSLMFLQDENEARTIFARKRISFKANATFINERRDEIFSLFGQKFQEESALGLIERFKDFHIIKFNLGKGRFVKGFGAAYDTQGLKVTKMPHVKNPHKM